MSEQKQKCYGCEHCKIWYDEANYTMRLSCMNSKSKQGKTITWASYPTYIMKNGEFVQTEETIESLTKEFMDYAKRRLSPFWCKKRKQTKEEKQMKMSNEELKEILDDHKKWLKDSSRGKRADLRDADLCDVDLSYPILRDADLCGANLHGANLHGAHLRGADLCGANLRGADLTNADLSNANLTSCDLRGANLKNANLSNAILDYANLLGTDSADIS